MAANRWETGLGTAGVRNESPGAEAVVKLDRMQGWQLLRASTIEDPGDDSLVDLSAPPADAVELPAEGQLIHLRAIADAAATLSVVLYRWPIVADDAAAGAAGGHALAVELITLDAWQVTGFAGATGECDLSGDVYQASVPSEISRLGAHWIAARLLDLGGTASKVQVVYRIV